MTAQILTDAERETLWQSINFWDDEADDLYPAVERIVAARVAEALHAAADAMAAENPANGGWSQWLRGRADRIGGAA